MKSGVDKIARRPIGITAIVIHGQKMLLLKKIPIPFVMYKGLWLFVSGKRERGEGFDETAFRELAEETGLQKEDLHLVAKIRNVMKFHVKDGKRFYDMLYVFRSESGKIRLNFENTAYRWASISDVKNERMYTNVFANEDFILKVIKKALQQ